MSTSHSTPPLSYLAYGALARCLRPLVEGHLKRRVAIGKEDANRLRERYGEAVILRPQGTVIWFHAASVGETLSILKLIDRLLADTEAHVLVTSGTVTSATLMAQRLPDRAIHQYAPLDHPRFVSSFLDHWQPDLAIWVESELWPSLIHQTHSRNIPSLLLNARMSEKSARSWSYVSALGKHLLTRFDACLAQDELTAQRLRRIGAQNVSVTGNLKLASNALPFDDAERARLDAEIGGRPVWVAASTHPGEDEIVLQAHKLLLASFPDILTVLVPRHPERGDAISELLDQGGHVYARRTRQDTIDLSKTVYLADTLGELGLIYALAKVAFVGGSLVPHGGQNPLEPARSDCAIITGTYTDNFADIFADLKTHHAAVTVSDAVSLAHEVTGFLSSETFRQEHAQQALAVATKANKVLDTAFEIVTRYLPREKKQ